MSSMRCGVAALVILVLAFAGIGFGGFGLALAQQVEAPQPPVIEAPTPIPSNGGAVKAARTKLDATKLDIDQIETTLRRANLSDAELQRLRQRIDPASESLRGLVEELGPRVEAAKARLEQLGPKPDDKAGPESEDVAKERSERESAMREADESLRLARALLVQAEQLGTEIGDRRRTAFTKALFERSASLLSPDLWLNVAQSLPRDIAALSLIARDWLSGAADRLSPMSILFLIVALGAAGFLYIGRVWIAPALGVRDTSLATPPRRRIVLAALGVFLAGAVPAGASAFVAYQALNAIDLLPQRIEAVAAAILGGLAFLAFARALGDALLAPFMPPWRLLPVSDANARRLMRLISIASLIVVTGKVLEALNQAIAAALPLTVATRGIFAVLTALAFAEALRRMQPAEPSEDECLGPYISTQPAWAAPLRGFSWLACALIMGATFAGYIAFASFLVDQVVWAATLAGLLWMAISLIDELIGQGLGGDTKVATALQANIGLKRRSLTQIAVLGTGVTRLALFILTGLLILAPWGIESTDLLSSLRAAFFGFKVGDVTISLSAVLIAALLFGIGFAATRALQRWLDTKFLPATDLDSGLRNSIRTASGYFGVIIAGAAAFSYLGLSLDRLTIIAGALSVGIGFGLQSIINNFVSGLILLWERPIRVGDLVVVGSDGEGYVRRINVRSTEIETFDRATVIVPNSNLISGVVKNRMRAHRTGRVVVSLNLPRAADAEVVRALLNAAALDHPDVLKDPPPRVLFKKIAEGGLDFDLVCAVRDVEAAARTSSDLHFAIFQKLKEAGIGPVPPPEPVVNVRGLDQIEDTLEQIAGAIEEVEEEIHQANARPRRPKTPQS